MLPLQINVTIPTGSLGVINSDQLHSYLALTKQSLSVQEIEVESIDPEKGCFLFIDVKKNIDRP